MAELQEDMNDSMDEILLNTSAKALITYVNHFTQDEAKRCRILLGALLLRMEDQNA